jgi:hypothetical protein
MKTKKNDFFEKVAQIIEQARKYVGRTADLTMCITYFEIGRMIVEQEQGGKARAEYGKGFSETNLKNARTFYQTYASSIGQTPSAKLDLVQKGQTLSDFFTLSWSHYLILMRIKNKQERNFYEIESAKQQWTFRQLQRQYGSSLR